MPYSLTQVPSPFTPPPALQAHLDRYPMEYGAQGRTTQKWAGNVTVWQIASDSCPECGYAWWWPRRSDPTAREIAIAVFDPRSGQGAASAALQRFETVAAASGITALCGQVNGNRAETGLRVRNWLTKHEFRLFDRSTIPFWPQLSDGDYLRRYPFPVYLRKTITPASR